MGWTGTHKDRNCSLLDFFKQELEYDNSASRLELLDLAAPRRNVAYGACRYTDKTTNESYVFAIVVLIKWAPRSRHNICYKEMSESMGPFEYDCPPRIFRLIEQFPPRDQYAQEWRAKVRSYLANRMALPKLRPGMCVEFDQPLRFENGQTFQRMYLASIKPLRLVAQPGDISPRYRLSRLLEELVTGRYRIVPPPLPPLADAPHVGYAG